MAKIRLKYAVKNFIYRASAKDLNLNHTKKTHDVIVLSVNKRNKTARVKTITSLEEFNPKSKKYEFSNRKLTAVRNGQIIVIPSKDLNSKVLCGVRNDVHIIKINKLFTSTSGVKFPRRYKYIITKNKKVK